MERESSCLSLLGFALNLAGLTRACAWNNVENYLIKQLLAGSRNYSQSLIAIQLFLCMMLKVLGWKNNSEITANKCFLRPVQALWAANENGGKVIDIARFRNVIKPQLC